MISYAKLMIILTAVVVGGAFISCLSGAADDTPAFIEINEIGISQNQEKLNESDVSNDNEELQLEDDVSSASDNLELVSLLSDKVEILMPKDFTIMSDELAELKYPLDSRPSLIYTNEETTVNLAFELTTSSITDARIPTFLYVLKGTYDEIYPTAEWIDSGTEEINGKVVGYANLVTPGIDTDIYNTLWFTELDGKILLCTFNCTVELMDEWAPIGESIKYSFRIK